MELVEKLRTCFFSCSRKGDARSRLGGPKYFVSIDLNLNRSFPPTWPVARQIYYNKRKRKQEKRTGLGHQHSRRFIGLGLTNIANLTSGAEEP